MNSLYQIKAKHFVAGLETKHSVVIFTAPIIKYMVGWSLERVKEYCQRKEWELNYIK